MSLNDLNLLDFNVSKWPQKISLQVSTFANEPWKENFIGIDFRQIDQNSRNSEKLVFKRFIFIKIDMFKEIF